MKKFNSLTNDVSSYNKSRVSNKTPLLPQTAQKIASPAAAQTTRNMRSTWVGPPIAPTKNLLDKIDEEHDKYGINKVKNKCIKRMETHKIKLLKIR